MAHQHRETQKIPTCGFLLSFLTHHHKFNVAGGSGVSRFLFLVLLEDVILDGQKPMSILEDLRNYDVEIGVTKIEIDFSNDLEQDGVEAQVYDAFVI